MRLDYRNETRPWRQVMVISFPCIVGMLLLRHVGVLATPLQAKILRPSQCAGLGLDAVFLAELALSPKMILRVIPFRMDLTQ
ncbi:hypothetical protein ASPSYDRAFT_531529 [Aspergillus sydowii CBS 593.65]|uniref:Uncharacterized protein n=1 Tax=Aspergillus sydowii CBS 593.65 TaxID=1036612 RepID=A0A1L9T2B6_9EURO|nr:uncharacterized protein ASPSYDRAFT_531529 [Aspergillus sydowii CBS 593.65]OJJ53481.1 hypothetical protein ASPSYDRAFT_531529 [Aspergillus sydowii CBS 593.65]